VSGQSSNIVEPRINLITDAERKTSFEVKPKPIGCRTLGIRAYVFPTSAVLPELQWPAVN
jgi:hypothetical protein